MRDTYLSTANSDLDRDVRQESRPPYLDSSAPVCQSRSNWPSQYPSSGFTWSDCRDRLIENLEPQSRCRSASCTASVAAGSKPTMAGRPVPAPRAGRLPRLGAEPAATAAGSPRSSAQTPHAGGTAGTGPPRFGAHRPTAIGPALAVARTRRECNVYSAESARRPTPRPPVLPTVSISAGLTFWSDRAAEVGRRFSAACVDDRQATAPHDQRLRDCQDAAPCRPRARRAERWRNTRPRLGRDVRRMAPSTPNLHRRRQVDLDQATSPAEPRAVRAPGDREGRSVAQHASARPI